MSKPYVPNDHTPGYDNFGKGDWNRPRDMFTYAENKSKINFVCTSCNGTGYVHGETNDTICPKCSRHKKVQTMKHGRTRIVYK